MRVRRQDGRNGEPSLLASDRQGFNRRWFAPHLRALYSPASGRDTVTAVQDAIETYGRGVKVTSGRHCYEDFVYNAGTHAIIDMAGLTHVGYDDDREAYVVDAGSETWSTARRLLGAHGKTLPAGTCYSVGAGGHISGGGYGLLSREHGLTVDWLTGVDIVTWNASTRAAELRHVAPSSSDPDERALFWALGGAGAGNFGVITRFYFAHLPDAPEYATLWHLHWDWAGIRAQGFSMLLGTFAEIVANELGPREFAILSVPHISAGGITLIVQIASAPGVTGNDHARVAERTIRRLRPRLSNVAGRGVHVRETATHLTYLEAMQTLNGSGPNRFGKYKSAHHRAPLMDSQVAALYEGLRAVPAGASAHELAASVVQFNSYGGAINSRAPDDTPIPQRSSILKLQYQTYWDNDSAPGTDPPAAARQAGAHLSWIRDLYASVYAAHGGVPDRDQGPADMVDGCYFNYPDTDLGTHDDGQVERALRLYFGDNLRRRPRNLVAVKQRWDAPDHFNHAQSIPTR